MQQTLGLPQLKLKLGVDHRWSSQYESLDRLLQAHQAIINIGLNDTEVSALTLTLEEWQDLAQIRDTLRPFKDIIDILQTSVNPSISMVKPLTATITKNILKITDPEGDYCQTIKLLVFEDFIERIKSYKMIEEILLLSCIIDPRFKDLNYLEVQERKKARD